MKNDDIKQGEIPQYDTCLVDVWVVIYDGNKLIEYGIKLLDKLMIDGGVILLGNTFRTTSELIHILENKGMDTSDLSRVITSGTLVKKEIESFIKQNDCTSFYHVGSIEPSKWLYELPINMSDNIGTSDIVICSNILTETEEKLIQITNEIKEKHLHFFITNSDKKIFVNGGCMSVDTMIDYCERNKIKVYIYGKPENSIFPHAIESIGAKNKTTCMVVGSSFRTDMLSANRCGIDSILVQSLNSISQIELLSNQSQPTYRVLL